jgi:hypothetical protein
MTKLASDQDVAGFLNTENNAKSFANASDVAGNSRTKM